MTWQRAEQVWELDRAVEGEVGLKLVGGVWVVVLAGWWWVVGGTGSSWTETLLVLLGGLDGAWRL